MDKVYGCSSVPVDLRRALCGLLGSLRLFRCRDSRRCEGDGMDPK